MSTAPTRPIPGEFHPPRRVLLGPGPSDVDPRVLQAMAQPLLSHLDPRFIQLMDDVQEMLRTVFQTRNMITLPISGTGSAGMEAALFNAIEPGDSVLICTAGYFGDRMAEIAERTGGRIERLQGEWGRTFDSSQIRTAIDRVKPRVVGLVHVETSTGVVQPLEPLGDLFSRNDIVWILDAVASLGGHPVGADRNQLDIVYSGSQKCLSCPPGLAPITLSEKASRQLMSRKTNVQSWYFDLTMIPKYWGRERTYHHTAPISMNYALREALRLVLEEGLDARFRRHECNHRALVSGIEAMGLQMLAPSEIRAWTVNTVKVPEGADDASVRSELLGRYGIEIVGGLGPFKGKIWRIGLMGASSTANNVLLLLGALEDVLSGAGVQIPRGAAVAAAVETYQKI